MRRALWPLIVGMTIVLLPLLQTLPQEDLQAPERTVDAPPPPNDATPPSDPATVLSGIEGCFEENLGQVKNPAVRYYARGDPLSIGLTSEGVILVLRESEGRSPRGMAGIAGDRTSHVFNLEFVDCNQVEPRGDAALDHPSNYYQGAQLDDWVTGVRSFSEVIYEGIYDGIDLRFYFKEGMLKYDFTLGPSAEPSRIVLGYNGISSLRVDDGTGDMIIYTSGGELRDSRPVIIQERDGVLEESPGDFVLLDDLSWGFKVPEDCDSDRGMVIDPGLEFSTFYGGSSSEDANSIVVDDSGAVYITGRTQSLDFPVSDMAHKREKSNLVGDCCDAFVAKIILPNIRVFSTYLGGNLHDAGFKIRVLANGDIWVLGETAGQFPTPGADSYTDAFLVRLDREGSWITSFRYSMAYDDVPMAFHVDEDGDFIIAGYTNSPNVLTHEGAYCRTYTGYHTPWSASFIVRGTYMDSWPWFDPMYGTYLNGISINDFSNVPVLDLDVDAQGNVLLAGTTESVDFPTNPDAFRASFGGGITDGFVIKFDPTLSRIIDSTFIGGEGYDGIHAIEVDEGGLVHLTGYTNSTDFPFSSDAFCTTSPGLFDAVIVVMDPNLTSLKFSSLLGGEGYDAGADLALGPDDGSVCILGTVQGMNLTCTDGCFDPVLRGKSDLFVAVVNVTSGRLQYCTYLGGSERDASTWDALACGGDGRVYVCGSTTSTDFPTTPDAGRTWLKGNGDDVFILSIDPRPCDVPSVPLNLTAEAGDGSVELSWELPETWGARVIGHNVYRGTSMDRVELIGNVTWKVSTYTDDAAVNGFTYYYAVRAVNSAGEGGPNGTWARPLGLPGAPRSLSASTGDGTVKLTWRPPEDTGGEILGYRVLRGTLSEDLDYLEMLPGDTLEYTDVDVRTGIDHYYAVMAFNSKGNGSISKQANVVPTSPPSPPKGFTVRSGDGRTNLSWNPPEDDGGSPLTAIRIYRGLSKDDCTVLIEMPPSELGFDDIGLKNGRRYYYYVTAVSKAGGEGSPTPTVAAVPFGLPMAPTDLVVEVGERHVELSWSPPMDDGGSPITGYLVYTGSYAGALTFSVSMDNRTTFTHSGLTNGLTYWYMVAAVNGAGDGPRTEPVAATPMCEPGSLAHFSGLSVPEGVVLSWSAPLEWGGADSLTYQVLRGEDEGSLSVLIDLTDEDSYLDTSPVCGRSYYYAARAVNTFGSGPTTSVIRIDRERVPGPVRYLVATAGDGFVNVSWSPPEEDGGGTITEYIVYKGTSGNALVLAASLGPVLHFNDSDVENLHTFFYRVRAVNHVGSGEWSPTANATPMALPGVPVLFNARVQDGTVLLSWGAPTTPGSAPVMGYVLMRGPKLDDMEVIARLGTLTSYLDEDVKAGMTYYYSIAANSSRGLGPQSQVIAADTEPLEEQPGIAPATILLLVVGIVAVMTASLIWARTRDKEDALGADVDEGGASLTTGTTPPEAPEGVTGYLVEQVLVVYRDGRLIIDCSKGECRTTDANLMSGMIIAVQGIVQDGLEQGGTLESIKYGENLILLSSGRFITLAAVIYGQPTDELKVELETTTQRIESFYAGVIDEWMGDLSALGGMKEMVDGFLAKSEDLTREDVGEVPMEQGITLLSAIDFHRGYVRLKVAALNTTDLLITDAALQVRYDPSMIRLERVEPKTLRLWGDRVTLGIIKPNERKTVALLFDPQICQETYIDGTLTYYNAKGRFQHVDMKRRHADVVCPVFVTSEHVNTAVLKRLMKEELHLSDLRMFRYPKVLSPEEVLKLGKGAIAADDVQLVREYIVGGPPYRAEVWYYAETRPGGIRIVMRLDVEQEGNLMGYFIASSMMDPITGVLAEFRRGLYRELDLRYSGDVRMEEERDMDVRREMQGRPSLLDDEEQEGSDDA